MTVETWPDPSVPYDYPSRTPINEKRWKEAISTALADNTLQLVLTGGDIYDLTGRCPRCGHSISQSIEFDVILGTLPVTSRFGVFNVKCNCPDSHDGRSDERTGCGWGGAIPVPLHVR